MFFTYQFSDGGWPARGGGAAAGTASLLLFNFFSILFYFFLYLLFCFFFRPKFSKHYKNLKTKQIRKKLLPFDWTRDGCCTRLFDDVVRLDCWLRPVLVSFATGVRVLFRCGAGLGVRLTVGFGLMLDGDGLGCLNRRQV